MLNNNESENQVKEKMMERFTKLNKTGKFDVAPNVKMGKKRKKLLNELRASSAKKVDYLTLCRKLDLKPSKLDKKLANLVKDKLIVLNNDIVELTEEGLRLLEKNKKQIKNNEKFNEFVKVLSDDEFNDFYTICNSLDSKIKKVDNNR